MLLKDKFYKVLSVEKPDENTALYHCQLLADCDCYRGHFPGKPVSPGVCNIEMIKECTMLHTGKSLLINTIKQCRLTAVATPIVCPEVDVRVNVTAKGDAYTVVASITAGETSYMEFKGEMTEK